jgi:hypothetical protein
MKTRGTYVQRIGQAREKRGKARPGKNHADCGERSIINAQRTGIEYAVDPGDGCMDDVCMDASASTKPHCVECAEERLTMCLERETW